MLRLTRAQVREIDRLAAERYAVPGIVLMENAARGVADVACLMATDDEPVLILCGGGNNGGDGLAAGRHLSNRGYHVTVGLYTDPRRYRGDAWVNWQITQAMGLPVEDALPSLRRRQWPLVIDAVFGTGLDRAPRDPFADLAAAAQAHADAVLAVDLPSGLDCDTGQPPAACIKACRTVTLVAEKAGFANPLAAAYLGRITVADIGCPRGVISDVVNAAS